MLYKNSFKLIFSNFSLVWKILLYLIIANACVFGLGYLVSIPIFNLLASNGWFDSIKNTYTNFVNTIDFKELAMNVSEIMKNFSNIISLNFSSIWLSVFALIFISVFLGCFVRGFYLLPTCNVVYYYMTSTSKQSFFESVLTTFKKNIKYSLVYLITILPIRILAIFIISKLIIWFCSLGGIFVILLPFIVCLIYVLFSSIRITFFCGWIPSLITLDSSTFRGIADGFKTAKRRLFKVLSNTIGLTISILFINVFALICTFGVGLIITIPLSCVWFATFDMVSFFTAYGMKFYIDPYNFMSPKKRELTEKVSSLKYLVWKMEGSSALHLCLGESPKYFLHSQNRHS